MTKSEAAKVVVHKIHGADKQDVVLALVTPTNAGRAEDFINDLFDEVKRSDFILIDTTKVRPHGP